MKRYLILLGALLIGLALRAQSVTYTCRYWFDQNHAQVVTASFSDSIWQAEFDVGSLLEGVHQFHLQIADTTNKWSPPRNYLFFKLSDTLQNDWTCHYWFDQNHQQMQHHPFGNGHLLLEVANLEEGMHTMSLVLESENLTAVQNYTFVKVATIGLDTLNMSHLVYHCWFDQDFEHRQTDSIGEGHFLLDVAELSYGLHTVNVLLEGDALTSTSSYNFMKVPVQDPAAPAQYQCWFDDDYSTMQTGYLGTGCFQLDVDVVPKGFHTVNVQVNNNGLFSAPQTYLFYRQPLGGYGLARWEYWLNDCQNRKQTTDIVPSLDTLDIMALLPVEAWPIRSTCFHFHPNGEEPYINAKNKISFRFWNTDDRFIEQSAYYVDENVSEPIVADTLERNTSVSIAAPRDNQIKWFKLAASRGDYLSFQADKACTMQLFAPSGEEVYSASGPESIQETGFNVWEDGTYYFGVHDANGSEDTISVTYNWVYRYNIASYDVHLVGNGGCSTITVQGNGFNSLLDAYLVNWQNDTIRSLDIGHESNTTTTVSFNFYQENYGVYDAVFEFFEETIRINGALEVQEPVDILLTSSVSYPSRFLRNTPCTYTYTITNNGNMSAYMVPIYMYIASPTFENITHIEIEGLNLPSLDDYMDLDSLSVKEIEIIKEWARSKGDDHYFNLFSSIENDLGNYFSVRSNYCFVNLAPFESKTIKLIITATTDAQQPIEAWMTVPSEVIPPYTLSPNRDFESWFCCLKDHVECFTGILSSDFNWAALVTDAAAVVSLEFPLVAPVCWAIAGDINFLSCLASLSNSYVSFFGGIICDYYWEGFWESIKQSAKRSGWSGFGSLLSCFPSLNDIESVVNALKPELINLGIEKMMIQIKQGVQLAIDAGAISTNTYCESIFKDKSPDCFSGPPKGGPSTPVNSLDPNDIRGYLSESGSHYMRQEIQNIHYEIEFENDTTLATAAAHTIIVRDTLDASRFDLNSLAARSVTIGDKRLELNGEQTFARTLDMRPELYVIAQINQDYDPATGIVEWTIQSLDPMTMEPTDDPNQGVLPVNYYGNGVGFIDYSVNLREPFADGTEISNRAGIIFDQEEVIMTPTWTNIVDAVKPTSHIEEVTPVADSLNFSFVSEDNRSGVWYHSLYYRNDSTDMQWQVKKAQITENSLMLFFDDFQTTEYLVMAIDSAGNMEEKEMVAEYTYYYEGPGPASQTNSLTQGWNWWSTYVEMNNVDGLGMLQNSLGHNGLTIKSQNDFTDNYYQDMGEDYWYGSLESIQNEQGYLINVADACSVTITGSAAIPALHPITIQPNWNWIGYPVAVPQTVANALAGFSPMPDDVVKGQSDFTSYYEGFGWYPDDFMLVPGQSYLYFSTANAGTTLTYASGSRGGALKSRKLGATYWNNNVHAYADNLSVMAVVKVDSVEQRDEHLELGAFVNGECRGSVRLRYFAPLDRYYAMLTVSGQEGDLVGFRLIHSESLEENETCCNHLVFSKNAIVGSLGKPYEVRFGEAEDTMVDMVLYPNPVERGATFSLMIPSGETVTEVIITDVVGNQLRHETGAINAKSIKGLPTAGVYVIKAVAKSGNTYHGRLIVE